MFNDVIVRICQTRFFRDILTEIGNDMRKYSEMFGSFLYIP